MIQRLDWTFSGGKKEAASWKKRGQDVFVWYSLEVGQRIKG